MIKKLELDGFELAYTSEGEGSDVLLLHGFPSNLFFWNDIKKELIKNFRVTVVEQRGYPFSEIQNSKFSDYNIENLSIDIEKLIINLNLSEKLIIVGHDWGSIVAWAVASRGNVNISKLVSICGGTEFPSSDVYKKLSFKKGAHYITSFQQPEYSNNILKQNLDLFFRSAYRMTPKINRNNIDLSLENLFNSYNDVSKVHNVDFKSLVNHFKEGLDKPISWYRNIDYNIELSSKWRKKIDTDVTFLFGENDAAVKLNKKMLERLYASGNNIEVKEISNADHWLPLTHKESIIDEFSNT